MTSIISVNRRARFLGEIPKKSRSSGRAPKPSPTTNRPALRWSKLPLLLASRNGLRSGATITEVPSFTRSVLVARYESRVTGSRVGAAPVMDSWVQMLS